MKETYLDLIRAGRLRSIANLRLGYAVWLNETGSDVYKRQHIYSAGVSGIIHAPHCIQQAFACKRNAPVDQQVAQQFSRYLQTVRGVGYRLEDVEMCIRDSPYAGWHGRCRSSKARGDAHPE